MDEAILLSVSPRAMRRSQELTVRLERVVPGGAHTYAKGADQYPEGMAPILERGMGSHVWDVDGHRYVELGSGLRSVALGHRHPAVDEAVRRALDLGANFTRPCRLELEAAETLVSAIPSAEMVKFAKNGSDATTAAVRLARAVTGRDQVVICRDQPFFSTDDWFIGTTPMSAGIPEATRELTRGFAYNDLAGLERVIDDAGGRIACVILEGRSGAQQPNPGFLSGVRRLCDEHGSLMVLDEMINGFRLAVAGAQELYDVEPDLSTFGKALGNGFAVSALVGRREYMELGGSGHGRERVFLLSTTHGAETHALAAATAVVETYQREDVVATLAQIGERLEERVREAADAAGVGSHVALAGHPANLVYATLDEQGQPSQAFRTLFLQELLIRGVIAPSFVVSAALDDDDIEQVAGAVFEAGCTYRKALDEGIDRYLRGRPVRPAIRATD